MAVLAAVELTEDVPAGALVSAVVEQVDGLGRAADLADRPGEPGQVPGVAAQVAHELTGGGVTLEERAGDAQEIVVVIGDQGWAQAVAGERVEPTVVGGRIQAPEAGAAGVGRAGRELAAQQPEEPEDDVGVAGAVGHHLARAHAGLRVEQAVEQVERVGLGAGHDHGVNHPL